MPRALIVEIFGNAKQFTAELDRAAGKTRQMGKVAGVAGLAIAGGLAYGMEKSVKAAMDAQASTARLNTAFKASGESAGKYSGQIDKAESAGRNLGFMNTDLRDSLGSLEVATHNHTKAIQLMGTAEDIARFKHVDLASASKMLTMAMAGSQRAAKQLGITIPAITTHYDALKRTGMDLTTVQGRQAEASAKLADKNATIAAVIAEVTKRTHGQAQAFSDTAAGGMQQFHAQLENIEEKLGKGLLPALSAVIGSLSDMLGWLSKHTTTAKIFVGALAALAAAMLTYSIATGIATAANTLFGVSIAAVALPIMAVVAAIAVLGIAAYEIYKHWGAISGFFTKLWNDVKGVFTAGIDFVKEHWRSFAVALATIIAGPIGFLVSMIATHWEQIKSGATAAWNAIKGALSAAWDAIKSAAVTVFNGIKNWFANEWTFVRGLILEPFRVGDAIANIIGDLPGRMAHSLKAAWHIFFDTVKKLFMEVIDWIGGAVKGVGSSIGHGIAGAAKSALGSLNPFGDAPPGVAGQGGTLGTLLAFAHSEGFNPSPGQINQGQHAPGSYHYQNRAVDMSGSASHMRRGFLDAISTFGSRIRELFYDPMGYYIKNGSVIKGAIGGHSDHVHLALGMGGIVTRPTMALIGERGPEAVIPLNRGGVGSTVHVTVNGWVGDNQALATKIRDELVKLGRREPNVLGGFA